MVGMNNHLRVEDSDRKWQGWAGPGNSVLGPMKAVSRALQALQMDRDRETPHTNTHPTPIWPLPVQCFPSGAPSSSTSAQPVNYPNSVHDIHTPSPCTQCPPYTSYSVSHCCVCVHVCISLSSLLTMGSWGRKHFFLILTSLLSGMWSIFNECWVND